MIIRLLTTLFVLLVFITTVNAGQATKKASQADLELDSTAQTFEPTRKLEPKPLSVDQVEPKYIPGDQFQPNKRSDD